MATGLFALLDDVAAIAKVAAASLDDVGLQATKAGAKAAGIVIDDAAVTPRYVVGFAAARELPIIGKIALGSLKNKLLFLTPAALALSAFAPWAITPLLMIGGAYLCFEGFEKVWESISAHGHQPGPEPGAPAPADAAEYEAQMVRGAIKTDFILSAEIMAITLSTVPEATLWMQLAVLVGVGIGITALVYGAVALLVKADDAGYALARAENGLARALGLRLLGRAMVKAMPIVLGILSVVGTAPCCGWAGASSCMGSKATASRCSATPSTTPRSGWVRARRPPCTASPSGSSRLPVRACSASRSARRSRRWRTAWRSCAARRTEFAVTARPTPGTSRAAHRSRAARRPAAPIAGDLT